MPAKVSSSTYLSVSSMLSATFTCFHTSSSTVNFKILGAPIESAELCAKFIEQKRTSARKLLEWVPKLNDPVLFSINVAAVACLII